MGNKKNKKNNKYSTHKSRRVYIKKKLPAERVLTKKGDQKRDQHLSSREGNSSGIGQGSRIIDVDKIKEYTDKVANHAKNCDGSIELHSESRNGLASVFTGECSTCQHTATLETCKKVKGPKGYSR